MFSVLLQWEHHNQFVKFVYDHFVNLKCSTDAYKIQANVMELIWNLFYNRSQVVSTDAKSVCVNPRRIIRNAWFDVTSRDFQPFVNYDIEFRILNLEWFCWVFSPFTQHCRKYQRLQEKHLIDTIKQYQNCLIEGFKTELHVCRTFSRLLETCLKYYLKRCSNRLNYWPS